MTGLHSPSVHAADAGDLLREQLSAMMDGELSPDETRFLLRRMQHDDTLADCWARWQYFGDAMRGECERALPADFSRRVGRAIADDLAQTQAVAAPTVAFARQPLVRWGGGAALAATVALAAFLVGRNPQTPAPTATLPPPVAAAPGAMPVLPVPAPVSQPQGSTPAGAPDALGGAAALAVAAGAVAVDSRARRPRMMAAEQALPDQRAVAVQTRERHVARTPLRAEGVQVAAADRPATSAKDIDAIVIKPWPRALVPGASGTGAYTAGYDGPAAIDRHPVFLPAQPQSPPAFEPPLLKRVPAAAGDATP
ncbi:MAG: sigma-E factor negative regulatory protein [Xanthomonadales bacterium]|nr:sigma-E factor negative regulatory protein [Xanthomonadales bacterium]